MELRLAGGVGGGGGGVLKTVTGGISVDSRLRICDAFAKGQVKLLSLEVSDFFFFRYSSVHMYVCMCEYICLRVCQQLLRPQYVNIYYYFFFM